MTARPYRRRTHAKPKDADTVAGLATLFAIGPYDRNQITSAQIDRLRDLVDTLGGPSAAERVGVCEITLLRVCAGFGHRLRPETAAKVRKFLGGR
jgi:hypothetical protein